MPDTIHGSTLARAAAFVGLAVAWPALQLAIFWVRFGGMPPEGAQASLVFLPMGMVSAAAALWFWSASADSRQRRAVLYGYLVASPFALVGSLLGGLALPGALGALVLGAGPLVLGSWVGYRIGRSRV